LKRSNKILLGGLLSPLVLVVGFIIFLTLNSTKDPSYQIQNNQDINWNFSEDWSF